MKLTFAKHYSRHGATYDCQGKRVENSVEVLQISSPPSPSPPPLEGALIQFPVAAQEAVRGLVFYVTSLIWRYCTDFSIIHFSCQISFPGSFFFIFSFSFYPFSSSFFLLTPPLPLPLHATRTPTQSHFPLVLFRMASHRLLPLDCVEVQVSPQKAWDAEKTDERHGSSCLASYLLPVLTTQLVSVSGFVLCCL